LRAVQQALASRGFAPKGGADGRFGPATKEAMQSWQYETGQTVTQGIDSGVLLALGVSATPSGAVRAAQATSTLEDATRAAHAGAALEVAKAKEKAATTPQAKAAAKQEVAKAEAQFNDAQPNFLMHLVPGIGRPVWQVGLIGLGVVALSLGIVTLFGGRRR
jgi:peptidoglycan hydrolase-like protein with peptidoglycan-binding domain